MSLAELLVALGLSSRDWRRWPLLSSALLAAFEADPAAAEQQQRARATMAVLVEDIARAGAGFIDGADTAPGGGSPAVLPDLLRAGAWAVGVRPSTLTVIGGARTAAHARLAAAVTAGESRLVLARPGFCSPASPTCRFAAGDDVLLTGPHGAFALAGVQAASPPLVLDLTAPLAQGWPAGTGVSVVTARAYALRPDAGTGLQQIVRAHGPGPATALVDFVERFDVEWLLDGAAPAVRIAPDGTPSTPPRGRGLPRPGRPATPRGPPARTARSLATPMAAACRGSVRSAPARSWCRSRALSDGPWCPSPTAPTRWDADLARVVGVRVRLDVAVATALLRAPLDRWPDGPRARWREVPRSDADRVLAPGRAAGQR